MSVIGTPEINFKKDSTVEAKTGYIAPPMPNAAQVLKEVFNDKPSAVDILNSAAGHIADRAAARDQETERSMARCVTAYNAITGHSLSERDGWMFMAVLKATRACTTPAGLRDDYEDGAAYFAFAGESAQ